jgi:hypothetical protein
MNRGPIYIAGLERSGTSLIFALLASHPNIAMTRRTNLWTHFYDQYGDLSKLDNFERCLDMMMHYKRLVVLEPDRDRIRREFWQGEPSYGRLFSLIEAHYAERLGKLRWGDKSLNTERYAVPIFEAFPSAKILHMIRDPRDRYASAVSRWKVSRGGIGAGTAMWLASVDLAQKNLAEYPDNYMIVRYETLAQEPEVTLRSICEFIGEEYVPAMLSMRGAQAFRDEGGNSSYGQRKPGTISTSSIGRFRQVLSRRQIAFMQARSKTDMADFSYELELIHLSAGEQVLYSLLDWPLNQARMIAWRTRELVRNRKGRPLPSYRIVTDPSAASA